LRPAAPGARRFRPDIQGLRAIAVLLVVLYHAAVPGIRGGYIGVDVFFVISGFLITGQLVRQVTARGRIFFLDFYLRRIRRLLPPAAIVVVATLTVSWFFANPLQTRSLGVDAAFTAFYGINYRLAAEGINYQNETAPPSALQHFWSLAVEEQYYLLWPVSIMLIVLVARRWWRRALPAVLVAGIAASLYTSQALLHNDQPLAYFSIQSRAWELGMGAMVALAAGRLREVPRPARAIASWAGLGLVLACGVCYTGSTSFPGYHAVPPVVGTALVIAAGCGGPVGAERLLRQRPMQALGKLSYPWYLWHWPVLLLAPLLAPSVNFDWIINLEMMLIALWFAALTYYLLEYPLKKLPLDKPRWLGAGLLISGTTAAAGVAVSVTALAALTAAGPSVVRLAAAGDPFTGNANAGAVTPSVAAAASDNPHYPADCIVGFTAITSPSCIIGPDGKESSGPVNANRVVLLGDSHAGQWFAPVHSFAAGNNWSVEVLNKQGCPLASITVVNPTLARNYTECNAWRSNMFLRLQSEPSPKIIFISSLNWYIHGPELDNGWAATLRALRKTGAPIVYLQDTPYPSEDVPACVSGALADWAKCDFSKAKGLRTDPLTSDTLRRYLAAVVNVNSYLCPGATKCPSVLDGVLLYRDESHVTNTAMVTLTPVIKTQLQKAGLVPKHTRSVSAK
jgi:peptidoglycan/LPS O-acetylase OafA/YrhL